MYGVTLFVSPPYRQLAAINITFHAGIQNINFRPIFSLRDTAALHTHTCINNAYSRQIYAYIHTSLSLFSLVLLCIQGYVLLYEYIHIRSCKCGCTHCPYGFTPVVTPLLFSSTLYIQISFSHTHTHSHVVLPSIVIFGLVHIFISKGYINFISSRNVIKTVISISGSRHRIAFVSTPPNSRGPEYKLRPYELTDTVR